MGIDIGLNIFEVRGVINHVEDKPTAQLAININVKDSHSHDRKKEPLQANLYNTSSHLDAASKTLSSGEKGINADNGAYEQEQDSIGRFATAL